MNQKISVEDNCSSFIDEDSGLSVFTDSFDNHIFNVRIGRIDKSELMGTISADNNDELNEKIFLLIEQHQEKHHR